MCVNSFASPQRAWCGAHHNERILILSTSKTVELSCLTGRCIIGSPFLLQFLGKEPVPFITVELTKLMRRDEALKSTPSLVAWPKMVLPQCLQSTRAYFESEGLLVEGVAHSLATTALNKHLRDKDPALAPARVSSRASMRELCPSSFFLLLERVEGSLLIFEPTVSDHAAMVGVIKRITGGRRCFKTRDSKGIDCLFVLMGIDKIEYDLSTQEIVYFWHITQFNSTGTERVGGAPIAPRNPASGKKQAKQELYRFSLMELDWVLKATSQADNGADLKKQFFEPEWFASHFGTWEQD